MTDTNVRDALIEELNNAFAKRSWHGANLMGAIRGITPSQAARRVHGRRSIWEQLLHAAYWKHRVLAQLARPMKFPRAGSNWPKIPATANAAAWRADVGMLRDLHVQLVAMVKKLPASKLNAKTRWLIHGAAAHDVYHAGQIKLLRRLLV